MGRQRDTGDRRRFGVGLDAPRGFPSIEIRKVEVHQNQIRPFGCQIRTWAANGGAEAAAELKLLFLATPFHRGARTFCAASTDRQSLDSLHPRTCLRSM